MNVGIVGATGAVGELMRAVLLERNFPLNSIRFLASERSAGKAITFAGKNYEVQPLGPKAFEGLQIVLSSTPSAVSRTFSPLAAAAGAYVVDNSSAWRMDLECPLVVPEVNADAVDVAKKRIIANPNCVAIPLSIALKPLHNLGGLKRVIVCTYQSSSGKGAKGLSEFDTQLKAFANNEKVPAPMVHRAQLAGNVITLDWSLEPNGFSEEENKVIHETRKILNLPNLSICPTCVRVPVRVAHSLAVSVELSSPVTVAAAKEALAAAQGVVLMDESRGEFPQPLYAAGSDHTYVGRVRHDPTYPNALALWIVADNLRKGAATNAVQCAEELLRRGLVRSSCGI